MSHSDKLTKRILGYYYYSDLENLLAKEFPGKSLHNFAGKFGPQRDMECPYQNFWHFMLSYWDDFSKGKPMYLNWGDMLEWVNDSIETDNKFEWAWVKPIVEKAVELFGDEDYTVIHDW